MKTLMLISALGALLALALVVFAKTWVGLGDVEMSFHGVLALVLGVIFTLALGCGLMYLVFYSSRHGHDDDVDY